MPHGDVAMELSSAFLGAVVGAVAAIIFYGFADKWEERAAVAREASYREACVKEYRSGWTFDHCQRDANRQAATAEVNLSACLAAMEKQDATVAEIDRACPVTERVAAK